MNKKKEVRIGTRVAKKANSKGEILTSRVEAEKSCKRRKKILLRRLCSVYESIGGRMAARFDEMLGTRYHQRPCRHAASSTSTAVRRRAGLLFVA